jgi:hypothetical protein
MMSSNNYRKKLNPNNVFIVSDIADAKLSKSTPICSCIDGNGGLVVSANLGITHSDKCKYYKIDKNKLKRKYNQSSTPSNINNISSSNSSSSSESSSGSSDEEDEKNNIELLNGKKIKLDDMLQLYMSNKRQQNNKLKLGRRKINIMADVDFSIIVENLNIYVCNSQHHKDNLNMIEMAEWFKLLLFKLYNSEICEEHIDPKYHKLMKILFVKYRAALDLWLNRFVNVNVTLNNLIFEIKLLIGLHKFLNIISDIADDEKIIRNIKMTFINRLRRFLIQIDTDSIPNEVIMYISSAECSQLSKFHKVFEYLNLKITSNKNDFECEDIESY